MKAISVCCALLLTSSSALAAGGHEKNWDANVGLNYTSYGTHSVGGLTLAGSFARQFAISDTWSARAGVDLAFTGFGDELHWAAILGGPMGSISVRPWEPDVRLTLGATLGVGQMPGCKGWQQDACTRNIGIFPALRLGVDVYTNGPMAVLTWAQARYINTIVGTWVAPSGGVDARVTF